MSDCRTGRAARRPRGRLARTVATATIAVALARVARADEPLDALATWHGALSSVLVGASLAADTNLNGALDALALPATFTVDAGDVPAGASLLAAYLWWGGTQAQPGGPLSSSPDTQVTLTPPGGAPFLVTAQASFGSDGGASSYDVWICRADVTAIVASPGGAAQAGTYAVDGYTGLLADGSTDNASASLLLLFCHASLPARQITLLDGLQTFFSSAASYTLALFPAAGTGNLSWHSLEGDPGSAAPEGVSADGSPGAAGPLPLSDAVNPAGDPMNRTINTSATAQTGVIGVDIDRLDLSAALTAGDTSLELVVSSGPDKWWLAVLVASLEIQPGPWVDLGQGLAGTHGVPVLAGIGSLASGDPLDLVLGDALENSGSTLVVGLAALNAPFKGGVLVPLPSLLIFGLPTGPLGQIKLTATWPSGVPSGINLYLQHWITDAAGPKGLAASNAIVGTVP